ncbi:uncharacterized protein, YkwD family [compost metagenome]
MKKSLFLLSVLIFTFSACKLDDGSVSFPEPEVDENITVVTNLDNDLILKLINDKRTVGCTCGTTVMPPVPALTWNNLLASAAAAHSKDMNANKFFDHVSPVTGKGTAFRVTATGYKWKLLAENLASGQIDEIAVVNAWAASESHCKNFMTANLKDMGAAKDGIYWTQVFGTKIAQ